MGTLQQAQREPTCPHCSLEHLSWLSWLPSSWKALARLSLDIWSQLWQTSSGLHRLLSWQA